MLLNINDKFYEADTVFSEKRLQMTDAEGNVWYRLTKPNRVVIRTGTVVGIVTHNLIGEAVRDPSMETYPDNYYHVRYDNGRTAIYYTEDLDSYITTGNHWFTTLEALLEKHPEAQHES